MPSRAPRGRRRWSARARSRRRSSCELCLRPDRAPRPGAERLPQGLRREGAARSRAGRSAAEGRARSGRCSACRSRSRTKSTSPARSTRSAPTPSTSRPTADCEMVRRLREAGAIVVGLTLLPEMAICGFTESATYGVTRNPWNPQRTPGRLERRLGRGGRRRPGPDRLGRRRRRLDPHPGRLLRPLRPEALARPGLAGARPRRLGRPRRRQLPQPHRPRHRALARRRLRRLEGARGAAAARAALRRVGADAARASCASPGRRRAPRAAAPPIVSDEVKRGRRRRRRAAAARSATTSPSATPTGAGSATTSPPASCAASPRPSTKCPHPERLERRTRGFGRLGEPAPRRALRAGAMARPRGRRRPRQRDLRLPTTSWSRR